MTAYLVSSVLWAIAGLVAGYAIGSAGNQPRYRGRELMVGRHSTDETSETARPEPVAIASAAQAVLAALVTLGWVTLDDTTISTIATAVGVVGAAIITIVARSKVTPVSDPKQ